MSRSWLICRHVSRKFETLRRHHMTDPSSPPSPVGKGAGGLGPEAQAHYAEGMEADRLQRGSGRIEFARTQEIVARHLPPPPAVIFDIGGGPGAYARGLARLGYEVRA